MTEQELKRLADLITSNNIYGIKEALTSDEAALYLGISKAYLYKLTMNRQIPYYKPIGKMIYFKREELKSWVFKNRIYGLRDI